MFSIYQVATYSSSDTHRTSRGPRGSESPRTPTGMVCTVHTCSRLVRLIPVLLCATSFSGLSETGQSAVFSLLNLFTYFTDRFCFIFEVVLGSLRSPVTALLCRTTHVSRLACSKRVYGALRRTITTHGGRGWRTVRHRGVRVRDSHARITSSTRRG